MMRKRNVALIVFYDSSRRILLQDRRGISKVGEEWGFFGGEIKEGETPEEAVVRETKEELDFDLKEFKYAGDYSYEIDDLFVYCKVFVAPLRDNLSKFKQLEGKWMRFFSLDEAEKLRMVSDADTEMVKRLKDIL
jgi:8-oxo-dGTP diphosphatase